MPWNERTSVLSAMKNVHSVIQCDDSDGSVVDGLRKIRQQYPTARLIFGNGGDRKKDNTPEQTACQELGIDLGWAWGGDHKANSSSWILENWCRNVTQRPWGEYNVLYENDGCKVKELVVAPGSRLSMQKHQLRSEFWFVVKGQATVWTIDRSSDVELQGVYQPHQHTWIDQQQWHLLENAGNEPLHMIEIQFGESCVEQDITRIQANLPGNK